MKPMEALLKNNHPIEPIDDVRGQAVGSPVAASATDQVTHMPTISAQCESSPPATERSSTPELPRAAPCISYERRSAANGDHRRISSSLETVRKFGLPPVTHEYYDDVGPGAVIDSPGYGAAKAFCIANRGAILVVEDADRLFRSSADAYDFSDFIAENCIVLYDSRGFVSHECIWRATIEAAAAIDAIHAREY